MVHRCLLSVSTTAIGSQGSPGAVRLLATRQADGSVHDAAGLRNVAPAGGRAAWRRQGRPTGDLQGEESDRGGCELLRELADERGHVDRPHQRAQRHPSGLRRVVSGGGIFCYIAIINL